jgi:sporulation protein YunB
MPRYPKTYRRYRKINRVSLFLTMGLSLLVTIYLFTFFSLKIHPTIVAVANARATNAAVRSINTVVNETMASSDITYNDLVDFKTDSSGQITALSSNIVEINKLKASLATKIQNTMSNMDSLVTKIPLGTLMGYDLLSGMGPRIQIKLIPVGYADIEVKNNFISSGINQTKHEVELLVTSTVSVLLPMKSTDVVVKTQIPIAQTIIVGTVPETYTNVSGAESTPEDIILNLAP